MADPDTPVVTGNPRKRRGVCKASITRIDTRLTALEAEESSASNKATQAKQLITKLNESASSYEAFHLALIDTIDDDDVIEDEQRNLDSQMDTVQGLAIRLQTLIDAVNVPVTSNERKITLKRLKRLDQRLSALSTSLDELRTPSVPHVKQFEEQLLDYKSELTDVTNKMFTLDLEDTDDVVTHHTRLEGVVYVVSLRLKELTASPTSSPVAAPSEYKGAKLPTLDVPTFDGDLLNWRNFWEQFTISIHERSNLSNSEKLVYLQQSLQGGSAKDSIEGLSRTGENYEAAVKCLKDRFDRPRLIHQAHVKHILDFPPLKEGTGKEIRKLHDHIVQHLRALKAMDYEPSGPFITSALELKLDQSTMFEWHRHSQEVKNVPHYSKLLSFLDSRAQATESTFIDSIGIAKKSKREFPVRRHPNNTVASHVTTTNSQSTQCIVCHAGKHPLYACPKFKQLSHENMIGVLKSNGLCMNCLSPNHFVKQCKSIQRCKHCQRPHHTLLHVESTQVSSSPISVIPIIDPPITSASHSINPNASEFMPTSAVISSNIATQLKSNTLMMTCRLLVSTPDGACVEARALLDNASSASFVSKRLAQTLRLSCSTQSASITGVAGITHHSSNQSITRFNISPVKSPQNKMNVNAIVVPKVTRDLPFAPVSLKEEWTHLHDVNLADPDFGRPSKIDLLLGVDIFVNVLLHGRRQGPPGTPVAFDTLFGWVLAGSTDSLLPTADLSACHTTCITTGDELLRRFWETEDGPLCETTLTPEERTAIQHFELNHSRTTDGRFVVPLPRRANAKSLGESRSMAVRRFLWLERKLHSRNQFKEFGETMNEYVTLGHAEPVPERDLNIPPSDVFYLPMHAVRKESSTTTKIRAVFDASMKSASGVSLNETLMIGPTVHSSLVDVLIRFRMHKIALVADISKMYRAVELPPQDRDLHRFVWRNSPDDVLQDFRMTRLTFGVSSSSFIANMAIKQNALDYMIDYPLAAEVVERAFYVDDCLTGGNTVKECIEIRRQLNELFARGDFILRKWNSSDPTVLKEIPLKLRDEHTSLTISDQDAVYTKTLGVEWHSVLDHFRIAVSNHLEHTFLTKRSLVSDIARIYDVLGWFSPTIIKAKILLQRVWEAKVDWDEEVPEAIRSEWSLWRSQLKHLSEVHLPRCYYPKEVTIQSIQLHGFSDASERAYAAAVYIRSTDTQGNHHISLVASKTKVAPIKRLTIPRLELCGAHLLAKLLEHVRLTLGIPIENICAWTDSTIVLHWLDGTPRRFKTYVGNRISFIVDRIPPNCWRHVPGSQNPADCASRGLLPLELIEHPLWWTGPVWLKAPPAHWPRQTDLSLPDPSAAEHEEVCLTATINNDSIEPLFPMNRFSSFVKLIHVTAWVFRFINGCKLAVNRKSQNLNPHDPTANDSLKPSEVTRAENYWFSLVQSRSFSSEVKILKETSTLPPKSNLKSLHPFLDSAGVMRVSGREMKSKLAYSSMHPIILSGKCLFTKLIIRSEHLRLLHAGPTLLSSSLNCKYHIIRARAAIRYITRNCVICLRHSGKPKPQQMGQLPIERITPDIVFENVGIDYAGPVYVKYGYVRKPTIVKSYICVFVSLSVKAVHLELVSDLTSDAFIAALRRFVSRRGKPKLIWSDHGTNFVGAKNDLNELYALLKDPKFNTKVSQFCSVQHIDWSFIPERAPHFGGLWESAVKGVKYHLKRVISDVKLTFEEYSTVLTQIEACLNSRPLVSLQSDDDGVNVLTPAHFLIGRPLEALPDSSFSYRPLSLLRRWHLCQNLVRQFWIRWKQEYLASLRRHSKWHIPTRNLTVGDVVVLQDDAVFATKWPLARVVRVFPGEDGLVRVVEVKTQIGIYHRPVTKIALILPYDSERCLDI